VEVVAPAVPWPGAGQGALVVANHVSWVDDVALMSLLSGIRPVAKAEVATWPVLGDAARRSGAVFLDRARMTRLPAAVAEVAGILADGGRALVHPEGTTSCGAELGRFRPAFFQAALDAAVPVCPVALRYRTDDGSATAVAGYFGGDSLRRSLGRVAAARGLILEVHLLPPVEPRGSRRELAALAEYAIAAVTEARAPHRAAHPAPVRPAGPPRPERAPACTPLAP
jgi:1-acyl-sn-glycerol-3-phosphate acyltransferase